MSVGHGAMLLAILQSDNNNSNCVAPISNVTSAFTFQEATKTQSRDPEFQFRYNVYLDAKAA